MKNKPINFFSSSPTTLLVAARRKRFSETWITLVTAAGLVTGTLFVQSCSKANAGPNGGDMVTLDNGKTNAEMMANSETGEAMVHTWNEDLKTPLPLEAKPLTLGTDANSVRLEPHPLANDPPGFCSRFYGRADWLKGGSVTQGWLSSSGNESERRQFNWKGCWKSGRAHEHMWSEMGHGSGMHQGGHGGMRP